MRELFPKKDILITLWANFPFWLIMINGFVNRRNPVKETINNYLYVLFVVNCIAMIVYWIVMRVRIGKQETYRKEMENQSWNDRMAEKYKDWQNI